MHRVTPLSFGDESRCRSTGRETTQILQVLKISRNAGPCKNINSKIKTRVYDQFCIETLHESRKWKTNGLSCIFEQENKMSKL